MEKDTFGDIKVPASRLWGAQTQRSLQNFDIGGARERMPLPLIRAFGLLKKAAAIVNKNYGLDPKIADAIVQACDEVRTASFLSRYPIVTSAPVNTCIHE